MAPTGRIGSPCRSRQSTRRSSTLRSGVAGELVQTCANYKIRLALVGDISDHIAASQALDAFVRESNRGRHVWFVSDEAELRTRLGG